MDNIGTIVFWVPVSIVIGMAASLFASLIFNKNGEVVIGRWHPFYVVRYFLSFPLAAWSELALITEPRVYFELVNEKAHEFASSENMLCGAFWRIVISVYVVLPISLVLLAVGAPLIGSGLVVVIVVGIAWAVIKSVMKALWTLGCYIGSKVSGGVTKGVGVVTAPIRAKIEQRKTEKKAEKKIEEEVTVIEVEVEEKELTLDEAIKSLLIYSDEITTEEKLHVVMKGVAYVKENLVHLLTTRPTKSRIHRVYDDIVDTYTGNLFELSEITDHKEKKKRLEEILAWITESGIQDELRRRLTAEEARLEAIRKSNEELAEQERQRTARWEARKAVIVGFYKKWLCPKIRYTE